MNPTNKSSGILTADGVVNDGTVILAGVQIITDGVTDVTLTIYDNGTAASGTVIFKQSVTGTDDSLAYWFGEGGIRGKNGIYADLTTAGTAEFIIFYR